jgi:hypothetical protein
MGSLFGLFLTASVCIFRVPENVFSLDPVFKGLLDFSARSFHDRPSAFKRFSDEDSDEDYEVVLRSVVDDGHDTHFHHCRPGADGGASDWMSRISRSGARKPGSNIKHS